MPLEIERKFLVRGDAWRSAEGVYLCQGYLVRDKRCTVRIRVAGGQAWLTVKGPSSGHARAEFEYPVPVEDARALLKLCDTPPVEKVRRRIPHGGHTWDVDEFLGANRGLVVAEVELASADQPFERPDWIGDEVTHDGRYYNARLAAEPYSSWPPATR